MTTKKTDPNAAGDEQWLNMEDYADAVHWVDVREIGKPSDVQRPEAGPQETLPEGTLRWRPVAMGAGWEATFRIKVPADAAPFFVEGHRPVRE